ncbi:citrate synthase [Pusillimonas sp.]|uniref:citrate synthase n=1 Tax=Pusillimonas sp. TaxID=3040095 RepID=UPI0029B0DFC5|nr:citrate synthase [Pusillimonas sp.]MDX3896424.1 citrate synthase [Pusillimonas sp.]
MPSSQPLPSVDIPAADAAELVTAKQACAMLGVKLATLYTYVSRGRLHPVAQAGTRANLYRRDEIESLLGRGLVRAATGPAASTLAGSSPVIQSSITAITPQGPRYRGHLAADLVRYPGAFENVAELLWSGVLPGSRHVWPAEPVDVDMQAVMDAMCVQRMPQLRMMRVLSLAATAMGGGTLAEELRSGSITRYSRQMLFAFAGCFGLLGPAHRYHEIQGEQALAEHVLQAVGIDPEPASVDAVNAALILSADHDLSPATFAARIAASTGSGLHACVVAALATHVGSTLAGGCDLADHLIRHFDAPAQIQARVDQAERNRERLPGFGPAQYSEADPRAAQLIEIAHQLGAPSREAEMAFRFIECVTERLGLQPDIKLGLAAVCVAAGLPECSASALWGMGRTAGWIAHMLEQRLAGVQLRPRSQYTALGAAAQ